MRVYKCMYGCVCVLSSSSKYDMGHEASIIKLHCNRELSEAFVFFLSLVHRTVLFVVALKRKYSNENRTMRCSWMGMQRARKKVGVRRGLEDCQQKLFRITFDLLWSRTLWFVIFIFLPFGLSRAHSLRRSGFFCSPRISATCHFVEACSNEIRKSSITKLCMRESSRVVSRNTWNFLTPGKQREKRSLLFLFVCMMTRWQWLLRLCVWAPGSKFLCALIWNNRATEE